MGSLLSSSTYSPHRNRVNLGDAVGVWVRAGLEMHMEAEIVQTQPRTWRL